MSKEQDFVGKCFENLEETGKMLPCEISLLLEHFAEDDPIDLALATVVNSLRLSFLQGNSQSY